ncbi:MAG: translation initiation factor IF-3 [Gemmatimonadales bacterium]|nr:translation initiation factor IF-3 [Gemmatimonadales bacterium]
MAVRPGPGLRAAVGAPCTGPGAVLGTRIPPRVPLLRSGACAARPRGRGGARGRGLRQVHGRRAVSPAWRTPLSSNEREKRVRINRMIRISPVRVIGPAGEQLGVLPVEEALAAAEGRGLDLVEVAPMARPPVVKIMDYGKFKFEEAKAARAAKKKQRIIELKEVKFRPAIDDHDFDFKVRHAREFLGEGNKVKVTMMFRGRQIAHTEFGKQVLDRVAVALADIGKIEADAKLEGRNMTMVIAPK